MVRAAFIALAGVDLDLAFAFEAADDLDDTALRGLDVLELERAHETHFLVDRLGGALGDAGEERVLELVAGGLERDCEVAHVDLAKNLLEAGNIEPAEILEGEHLLADAGAELRVAFLEGDEERLADVLVERVEQLGGELHSTGLAEGARGLGTNALVEHLDELLDNFDGRGGKGGDALDDLLANFRAEQHEELRALRRAEVAHDERDGLRLLMLEKVVNLPRLHLDDLLHRGEWRADGGDAADDVRGAKDADGLLERVLRVADAAEDAGAGLDGDLGEFLEKIALRLLRDHRELRHLGGDAVEFALVEVLHHLRGGLGTNDDEKRGELLHLVHLLHLQRW